MCLAQPDNCHDRLETKAACRLKRPERPYWDNVSSELPKGVALAAKNAV